MQINLRIPILVRSHSFCRTPRQGAPIRHPSANTPLARHFRAGLLQRAEVRLHPGPPGFFAAESFR
jgi:hypothetical protein